MATALVAVISAIATFVPGAFSFLNYIPFGDKLGHFFIFGLLSLVLIVAIPNRRAIPIGIALATLIVLIEEGLQLFSSTRSFSVYDLAASLAGVLVFALGTYFAKSRRSPQQGHEPNL